MPSKRIIAALLVVLGSAMLTPHLPSARALLDSNNSGGGGGTPLKGNVNVMAKTAAGAAVPGASWSFTQVPAGVSASPNLFIYQNMAFGTYSISAGIPAGYKLVAIRDANGKDLNASANGSASQALCAASPAACAGSGGTGGSDNVQNQTLIFLGLRRAFAQTQPYITFNLVYAVQPSADGNVQGNLEFSPGTVKNDQDFTIKLTGGSANRATKIWVDNGDGKGFVDFGGWLSTDASGGISVSRKLNCAAYNTLVPNQTVPIGNRVLSQKAYVEYVGTSKHSSIATHSKDCTTEAQAPTVTDGHIDIPAAPASQNGLISFVKTVFYNSEAQDGYQHIEDMSAWGKNGDKFVISGNYGASFAGLPLNSQARYGGGGLWVVAEDGSKIVERHAALDAGASSNVIGHHGIREISNGQIHLEWASGGFLLGNGSMNSACPGSCAESKAAYQAVYYKQGADGYPYIAGKYGDPERMGTEVTNVFKNKAIINGGSPATTKLVSLPGFADLGGDTSVTGGWSLGNNIFMPGTGKLYSVADDGGISDTGQNLIDSGYEYATVAWDWSTGFPPKLGIWEVKTNPDFWSAPATANPFLESKVKVYKLAADGGVALDRTMNAPLNPGIVNGNKIFAFGLWGDYLVTGGNGTREDQPAGTGPLFIIKNAPIYVWKGDQKVDTVILPVGYIGLEQTPKVFAISKDGYVLVNASWNAPRTILVYLYKLNAQSTVAPPGTSTSTPPVTTPPVITPPLIPPPQVTSNECFNQYRDLCDAVSELRKAFCALNPAFCGTDQR